MLQLCCALVTLVHLFLFYDMTIWGATYPTYIKRLKFLQNRPIRAVSRCDYLDQVNPYYIQFKIFQIDDLLKNKITKFVHCYITNRTFNLFPSNYYFRKTVEHSSRVIRQSSDNSNFHIPRYRTNKSQMCIKYQEVKV